MMCRYGEVSRSGRVVYCRADLCAEGEFPTPSLCGIYSVPRLWCEDACPVGMREALGYDPRERKENR